MLQPPDFSLPECSEALVKYMDASGRRKWRLLCRACCQHVYENTKTLTWILNRTTAQDHTSQQHPDRAEALEDAEKMAKQDLEAAGRTAMLAAGTEALRTAAKAAEVNTGAGASKMPAAAAAAAAGSSALVSVRTEAGVPAAAVAAVASPNPEQGGPRVVRLQRVEARVELIVHVDVDDHVTRAAKLQADSLARSFARDGLRVSFHVQAKALELPCNLLRKLRNLRALSCRGTSADSLSGLPAALRLDKLDISYSRVSLAQSAEPLRLLGAAGLRCLVAQGLRMCVAGAEALSALAPSLQELNIDNLAAAHGDEHPLRALTALTRLSSLSMRRFAGQPATAAALPALAAMTRLTHLDCSGLLTMSSGADRGGLYQALGQALLPLTKLQVLLLSVDAADAMISAEEVDMRTGAAACRSISAALQQSRPPLTTLVLEHSLMTAAGMASLAHALPVFQETLVALNLRGGFMAAEGAKALAPSLSRLGALRQLDLAGNLIGDEGIAALAPALAQLLQLRGLCLADNRLGVAGVASLAAQLGCCTALEELLLGRNRLGDEGAEVLRAALCALRALRVLDLGCCQLSMYPAAVVGRWQAAAPSLVVFNGGSQWVKQLGGTAACYGGYEYEEEEDEPYYDEEYEDYVDQEHVYYESDN